MASAGTSLAPWADSAIFGDKTAQKINLFVVDVNRFICAELTDLWFGYEPAWSGKSFIFAEILFRHFLLHGKYFSNMDTLHPFVNQVHEFQFRVEQNLCVRLESSFRMQQLQRWSVCHSQDLPSDGFGDDPQRKPADL